MPEFGRYEVIEEIGRGAMGAVYKANDPVMDRVVAIKTILATALAGPQAEEYRERFKREAKAAGRLSHPGVVTVYDVGVQDDTPYLVMEFVPSRTLESAIESGDRFSVERTMEIGQQLASALGYAHKNGVVHRDIKPANVLLTAETPERAKITDFGVAKLSAAQATSTGALLGTPMFMAPEQFTGMGVDGRSDLFSLGVVLYWMATGDRPFSGETITAVSYKIVHTDPIPPRTLNRAISPAFESVLLKCLEKDPAERYQSGELLAQDLGNLREGRSTASQISAMRTVVAAPPVEPQTIDPQATIPLAKKTAAGTPVAAIPPADVPPDAQETAALSSTGKPQRRAPSASPAAAAPEVRAAQKPAAAAPISAVPPRPITPAPPSRVLPRPQSPPEPRSSGSRGWMIAAAVLLVLGLLWGGSVVKKNRDEAAASLAAQQQAAAQTKANEEAHETKKQEAAEQGKANVDAKEKTAAETPAKPRIEKAREEPREEAQPDVSNYALRLEVTADSPTTVEIQSDDRPGASRLLKTGHKFLVGADKVFLLRTDNAGALKLKMNNQDLAALGPLGVPRTVRLTARDLKTNSGSAGDTGGAAPQPEESTTATKAAAAAKILAGRTGKATVIIDAPNIPNRLDIVVWVDDQPIFQRKANGESGTSPVSAQRFVSPGAHEFRVYVGSLAVKRGIQKKISGEFTASESKTLRVLTRKRGEQDEAGKTGFILSLE